MTDKLTNLTRSARELAKLDPASQPIADACEAAFASANDLARSVQSYHSALEGGPGNLAELEARLDVLQMMKRKYGATVEEVLLFQDTAAQRLAELKGREARRDTLDADIAEAEKKMQATGGKLSAARKKAAGKLAEKVCLGLKDLGFAKAEFSVSLETLPEAGPHGGEMAEFQFAPNPGEPAHPLRSIASSGEISRVMLALKSALADQDDVPVLIFDEIDANVGGEIAAKVGQKMRELGQSHQVLCITHLPQVAAAASAQFLVEKEVANNRTRTSLTLTEGVAREEEIARMLGGKSASALAHAKALLGESVGKTRRVKAG